MSEETSFEDYEENTSISDSESLEAESTLKKESGDLFRSESDIETSASESYSEDIEADSSTSFVKESIEDVFEVEQDGTGNEPKSFNNAKQITAASVESKQLVTESLAADSCTSGLEKGSVEDEFEDQQDGIGNESYGKAEQDHTVITKSSNFATEASKTDGTSNLEEASIEESFKHDLNEDETRNESISNAEKRTPDKSPLSPTEAMKALSISNEPSSGNKNTPRQSRFRAKTFNIFDSPYNTRLKARMIQERELRSRSEGGSTDE